MLSDMTAAAVLTKPLSTLRALEAESIHILREVAAEFERPGMLFSGGKDSIVMLHLARKAFWPARIPFPVVHVDTGHNFAEVLDTAIARLRTLDFVWSLVPCRTILMPVEWWRSRAPAPSAIVCRPPRCCAPLKKAALTPCSAVPAETRTRPGPRSVFSRSVTRSVNGIRANQRPELWSLYNGRIRRGEHIRVFPISNWTELDIWQYISEEGIELPSIYYAHDRQVFQRDGMWIADSDVVTRMPGEKLETRRVRFRTVGDASCTGAVDSYADTPEKVIAEISATRITERGATRADDRISEAGMEDRKKEGYF